MGGMQGRVRHTVNRTARAVRGAYIESGAHADDAYSTVLVGGNVLRQACGRKSLARTKRVSRAARVDRVQPKLYAFPLYFARARIDSTKDGDYYMKRAARLRRAAENT